jgi:excisionase family DNA binding protein
MRRVIDLNQVSDCNDGNLHTLSSVSVGTEKTARNVKRYLNDSTMARSEVEHMLRTMFPLKITFTLQEVAKLLNISYEFVRNKTSQGLIPCVSFGKRKMINVSTVIDLIIHGV